MGTIHHLNKQYYETESGLEVSQSCTSIGSYDSYTCTL
uniref:Uncharacterized protein n=1 Tax=Anguilla anguilla TaxID=7936 RepID=A0A0E9TRW9_ANGAN